MVTIPLLGGNLMEKRSLVNCKIHIPPHFMLKAEQTSKTELYMKLLIKWS